MWAVVWLGLLASLATTLYGVWLQRPLSGSGAFCVLLGLEEGRPQLVFFRYLDWLLELPMLFLRKALPQGDHIALLSRVWGAAHSLYPYLGLWACWLIVRKKHRELFLLPVFAFATGTLVTLPFAHGESPQVPALFFPLLLVLLTRDLKETRYAALCGGLILLLGMTHEAAALALAWVGALTFYRAWVSGPRRLRRNYGILSCLAWTEAGWCVLRSFRPFQDLGSYADGFSALRFPWVMALLLSSAAFMVAAWGESRLWNKAVVRIFYGVALVSPVAGLFAGQELRFIPMLYRVFVIPNALALATLALFLAGGRGRASALLVLTVGGVLLCSSIKDLRADLSWRDVAGELRTRAASTRGCHILEVEDYSAKIGRYGIWEHDMPLFSILLQETRKPKAILFSSLVKRIGGFDPCELLARQSVLAHNGDMVPMPRNYFVLDWAP